MRMKYNKFKENSTKYKANLQKLHVIQKKPSKIARNSKKFRNLLGIQIEMILAIKLELKLEFYSEMGIKMDKKTAGLAAIIYYRHVKRKKY